MRKLYVGNLPFSAMEQDLKDAFGRFGDITFARVVTDRETGQSRGFGFVEFSSEESARSARDEMDGADLGGRMLRVNEAEEKGASRRGGGGGRPSDGGGAPHGGGGGGRGRRQGKRGRRRRGEDDYDM